MHRWWIRVSISRPIYRLHDCVEAKIELDIRKKLARASERKLFQSLVVSATAKGAPGCNMLKTVSLIPKKNPCKYTTLRRFKSMECSPSVVYPPTFASISTTFCTFYDKLWISSIHAYPSYPKHRETCANALCFGYVLVKVKSERDRWNQKFRLPFPCLSNCV